MSDKYYTPRPTGEGVHFLHAKPNAKESRRIDLIVRVDRAVMSQNKRMLRKLLIECKEIQPLKDKIAKALKG